MIYSLDQQVRIWTYYFYDFDMSKGILNPLRKDNNPKCYFKESNGVIFFIDWAYKPTHLNCINYVAISFNLTNKEAIYKINKDLKFNNIVKIKRTFNSIKKSEFPENKVSFSGNSSFTNKEKLPLYTVKDRNNFYDYELDYWEQYNITLDILKKYEVKPIDYVFKNSILNYSASKYNPIFGYYKKNELFKIYNPEGVKSFKWRTLKAILEGYDKLKYKTNVVFITSSYKDTMCLDSLGFDSFNLASENSYKLLLPIINNLFEQFEYIYIYLNNDETGVTYSRLLTLEIDKRLKYINNPAMLKETDPSDIIKNIGVDYLNGIITEKLKKDNIILKYK